MAGPSANVFGGWWQRQQAAKASAENAKKYKPPKMCTFCTKKIEDGDFFYAGYDRNKIYAETCDHIKCYQWLVKDWRVRKKRISDTEYR